MKSRPTRSSKAKTMSVKPGPKGLINTVARTVGSALGTIVATGESVIGKPGEVFEALKSRATSPAKKAPPKKKAAAPVRKKAAARKRTSAKARKTR